MAGAGAGRVSIAEAAGILDQLGERFDALKLKQREQLVRAFLRVTVRPGRTDDRLVVERLADLGRGPAEVLTYA